MNNKFKKVMNIIFDIIVVLFLIFAAFTLVISLSQKTQDNNPGGKPSQIFGVSIRSVQSESMEPYNQDGTKYESENAFYKGDIIFCDVTDSEDTYEVGDAVMFWMPITNGTQSEVKDIYSEMQMVTHEIIRIEEDAEGTTLYYTQGLNRKPGYNEKEDVLPKTADELLAKYNGTRIGGLGKVIDFVKTGLGFLLCIILPILIFVIIQAIRVIRNFIAYKAQKAAAAVASGELSDEQKKLIAEEYLKQQQAAEDDATSSTVEDTADGE